MDTQASLVRKLLMSLDRPGRRWLLGIIATVGARLLTRRNIRVFYDGLWVHGLDGEYYGDGATFDYYAADFRNWCSRHDHWREEAKDCWFHKYVPKSGDVIIDIGAGIGTDILVFSKAVGPSGHVYAIEAHPDTFRSLEKTCLWNRLDNVTCIQMAVAERAGELYISDLEDHGANFVHSESNPAHSIPVQSASIDEIFDEYEIQSAALLKMNIEGAEQFAILGMDQSVTKISNIAIACHDFLANETGDNFFRTRESVTNYFESKGFSVIVRDDDPRPYVQDHIHASPASDKKARSPYITGISPPLM